jgi:hypothetical protein
MPGPDVGPMSRDNLEAMASEVMALRPRVAALEALNRRLRTRLTPDAAAEPPAAAGSAGAPVPPQDPGAMSREDLQALAGEVFALRRRVVELDTENRQLKMQLTSAAPEEPPVPKTPETGFAFGIADAEGRREVVVARDIVKLGKAPSSHVLLEGARLMHAVIERDADGVSIIDMGTPEGTLVNGQRITKTRLSSGDRLGIADARLVVVFGPK